MSQSRGYADAPDPYNQSPRGGAGPRRYNNAAPNPYDQRGGAGQGGYTNSATPPPRYPQQPPYPRDQYGQTMGRDDDYDGQNVELASLTKNGSKPALQSDANSILTSCSNISNRLNDINGELVQKLGPLQKQALSGNQTNAERQLEDFHTYIMAEYRKLTEDLKDIKRLPESTSSKFAQQVRMVDKKLKQSAQDYQESDMGFRKALKSQLARQMRIVNPELSEDEINDAVDNTRGGQQIFAQALMQGNRRGQATTTLDAVRSRHEEIQRIEQQIKEVAELFQQMNEMVEQQEVAVTNIEMKGEEVVENMDKGTEEIGVAVKTARATRRKKWWCLGICVAIIIIIVIIILIYVFVIKGTGKTTSNNKRFLLNDIIMKSVPVLPNTPWTPKRAIDFSA